MRIGEHYMTLILFGFIAIWLGGYGSYKGIKQLNTIMIKIPRRLNLLLFLKDDYEVPLVLFCYQVWVYAMAILFIFLFKVHILSDENIFYAFDILVYSSIFLLGICHIIASLQNKIRKNKNKQ